MRAFIDSGPGHPHWNMAVDEALLLASADDLTLRVYGWDPPGLSLGYFQPSPGDAAARAERAGYAVTRRLTGGGASTSTLAAGSTYRAITLLMMSTAWRLSLSSP